MTKLSNTQYLAIYILSSSAMHLFIAAHNNNSPDSMPIHIAPITGIVLILCFIVLEISGERKTRNNSLKMAIKSSPKKYMRANSR